MRRDIQYSNIGDFKKNMKVAVYDTYVKKSDRSGSYHFDIIIEKNKLPNSDGFVKQKRCIYYDRKYYGHL